MKIYPLNTPTGFNLATAKICGRLLDHSYGAIRQAQAQHYPKDFVWKKPSPTIAGLQYSEFAMAEIEYRSGYTRRTPKRPIYKERSTPLAFVAYDSNRVFVVLRGTALKEEWMKINAKFKQESLVFKNKKYGAVHRGFKKYYSTIATELRHLLEPLVTGRDLIITGHSLGGGVAAVALADCVARYSARYKSIVSYSFASPRVGNPEYSARLAESEVEAFRVVNTEDLVPDLPPANIGKLDFRHYGALASFTAHYGTVANIHNTPALIYALEHKSSPECKRQELVDWAIKEKLIQKPTKEKA